MNVLSPFISVLSVLLFPVVPQTITYTPMKLNSRLLSVNYPLIPPILVLWVTLLLNPSTTVLTTFIPGWKTFLQILPTTDFFSSCGLTQRIPRTFTDKSYFWASGIVSYIIKLSATGFIVMAAILTNSCHSVKTATASLQILLKK